MKRRHFLACLAALAAGNTGAQTGKPRIIGVLRAAPDDAVFRQNFDRFRLALRERGFEEGTSLRYEYRVRPGTAEQMLALANELVRAKVDAILAIASAGVSAAAKATTSVPIVAVDLESDPVGEKYAASLARPGGNVTGVFLDFPELSGKWIQLLKEAIPKLARIAVLADPAIGNYLPKGAETAASSMGVRHIPLEARSLADFARAFDSAAKQKADALLALSSPVFNSARKQIAELALEHRLPAVMPFPQFADAGGLLAYGPHLTSLFRQAGGVMANVLRGEKPGEIPIERPTKFEFAINLKTARALGLSIPQSVLLRADRVIE